MIGTGTQRMQAEQQSTMLPEQETTAEDTPPPSSEVSELRSEVNSLKTIVQELVSRLPAAPAPSPEPPPKEKPAAPPPPPPPPAAPSVPETPLKAPEQPPPEKEQVSEQDVKVSKLTPQLTSSVDSFRAEHSLDDEAWRKWLRLTASPRSDELSKALEHPSWKNIFQALNAVK